MKRVYCAIIALSIMGFAVSANTYNDWAQKNAVNLDRVPETQQKGDEVWSGTWDDLKQIQREAWNNYGHFESLTHLGRDAVELKPYSLLDYFLESNGKNHDQWNKISDPNLFDGFHQPGEGHPIMKSSLVNSKAEHVKFNNSSGGEVAYDLATGRIVLNELLGTKNFGKDGAISATVGPHEAYDIRPNNERSNQYKYAGILYEIKTDANNQYRYYIVDGQTRKRMTNRQAHEFPTTLTDMWKEKGRQCVSDDGNPVLTSKMKLPLGLVEPASVLGPTKVDPKRKVRQQSTDLHSLNLDDPNGDWCKCNPPGCIEKTTGEFRYVQCQCAKCGKVNVEYARRALAMEKEVNAQGGQTQWWGNRSDAVKAANTQK